MFIQRTKDSTLGYFDSGPWDTLKHDADAFFCKYYKCKNYEGFFGFKAADLVAYCEKAIKDENYHAKHDSSRNIGNVSSKSYKIVYMFYLPHIVSQIKTYRSVGDFATAIRASQPAPYADLYAAYVRASHSPRPSHSRIDESPDQSPRSRPSVLRPPTPQLV